MFEIQKQDSTRSSATGSNTNRDVDKNSDTVNFKYTKAQKREKFQMSHHHLTEKNLCYQKKKKKII